MSLSIRDEDELLMIINKYKKNNKNKFDMVFSGMENSEILDKLNLDIYKDFHSIVCKKYPEWDNDMFSDLTFSFIHAYVEIGDIIEKLMDSYIDNHTRDMNMRKELYFEYLLQIIPFAYMRYGRKQSALDYRHVLKYTLALAKIIEEL